MQRLNGIEFDWDLLLENLIANGQIGPRDELVGEIGEVRRCLGGHTQGQRGHARVAPYGVHESVLDEVKAANLKPTRESLCHKASFHHSSKQR